ncbi:hypothetical protein BYT27DRAFT_7010305, partial [Phlegmacium glaucopus]
YRPINKEELFNLCHSSAQNVIERIFGFFKPTPKIQQYGLEIQAHIPSALAAIHNFIHLHDP